MYQRRLAKTVHGQVKVIKQICELQTTSKLSFSVEIEQLYAFNLFYQPFKLLECLWNEIMYNEKLRCHFKINDLFIA